jgi:hypothetical protein
MELCSYIAQPTNVWVVGFQPFFIKQYEANFCFSLVRLEHMQYYQSLKHKFKIPSHLRVLPIVTPINWGGGFVSPLALRCMIDIYTRM